MSTFVKKKQTNFSNEEIEILLSEVERRRAILFSKFSTTVTNQLKIRNWTEIKGKINAVKICMSSDMFIFVEKYFGGEILNAAYVSFLFIIQDLF